MSVILYVIIELLGSGGVASFGRRGFARLKRKANFRTYRD